MHPAVAVLDEDQDVEALEQLLAGQDDRPGGRPSASTPPPERSSRTGAARMGDARPPASSSAARCAKRSLAARGGGPRRPGPFVTAARQLRGRRGAAPPAELRCRARRLDGTAVSADQRPHRIGHDQGSIKAMAMTPQLASPVDSRRPATWQDSVSQRLSTFPHTRSSTAMHPVDQHVCTNHPQTYPQPRYPWQTPGLADKSVLSCWSWFALHAWGEYLGAGRGCRVPTPRTGIPSTAAPRPAA